MYRSVLELLVAMKTWSGDIGRMICELSYRRPLVIATGRSEVRKVNFGLYALKTIQRILLIHFPIIGLSMTFCNKIAPPLLFCLAYSSFPTG
jgi:hypothetical protein